MGTHACPLPACHGASACGKGGGALASVRAPACVGASCSAPRGCGCAHGMGGRRAERERWAPTRMLLRAPLEHLWRGGLSGRPVRPCAASRLHLARPKDLLYHTPWAQHQHHSPCAPHPSGARSPRVSHIRPAPTAPQPLSTTAPAPHTPAVHAPLARCE